MDTLLVRLPEIVVQLLALAVAISVHESAHGWTAERLGDPTARWLGRITLNPIKHIDPFGTVLFPLLLAVIGAPVIGWAKPVPYVPRNLRNPRRDPALVALAGPVSNLCLALIAVALLHAARAFDPYLTFVLRAVVSHGALGAQGIAAPLLYLLFALALVNTLLAGFNLVPIPPLDGSKVLAALLPARWAFQYALLERYGMLILFALVMTGFFGRVLAPVFQVLQWLLAI